MSQEIIVEGCHIKENGFVVEEKLCEERKVLCKELESRR